MSVVFFCANRGYALKSSRSQIIKHFLSSGWEVVLCTADDDDSRDLEALGVKLEVVRFARGSKLGLRDVFCYLELKRLFLKYKPSLVHCFHSKPVIISALALRGCDTKMVATITGLGHAFIKGGLSAKLAGAGYKFALPRTNVTVFQNSDDRALFVDKGWLNRCHHKVIVGSGVDLRNFSFQDRSGKEGPPSVLMLGRLLAQKGVFEFIKVADDVCSSGLSTRFVWAGEVDKIHPDAVPSECFRKTNVHYPGRVSDVKDLLKNSDVFLFPSYREGVPRAVMEASASGMPTVAFDVPGVREVVRDGVTGFLVPFGDTESLTEKTALLLHNKDMRLEMGRKARKFSETYFDIRMIQSEYVTTYQSLGIKIPDFPTGDDVV